MTHPSYTQHPGRSRARKRTHRCHRNPRARRCPLHRQGYRPLHHLPDSHHHHQHKAYRYHRRHANRHTRRRTLRDRYQYRTNTFRLRRYLSNRDRPASGQPSGAESFVFRQRIHSIRCRCRTTGYRLLLRALLANQRSQASPSALLTSGNYFPQTPSPSDWQHRHPGQIAKYLAAWPRYRTKTPSRRNHSPQLPAILATAARIPPADKYHRHSRKTFHFQEPIRKIPQLSGLLLLLAHRNELSSYHHSPH